MQQGLGADGGFLVPPEFSATIWDGLNKDPDNIFAMTDGYTVTGESLTMNANAETSRATGSRWGGVRAYWIAEADQITSSKPTFRQVKLEPQQLAVLVYVTDKLLRNATALDQYVGRAAVSEINLLVSDAVINGTGAGQPLGILNSPSLVSVLKETGQAAATIVPKNVVKMFSRCHARSRRNAIWLINQDIEPQLHLMNEQVGTGGQLVYLPPGGLSQSPYGTLYGRPIMPVEYTATLGTVGDIMLVDLSAYASGTQGGIDSAMSMHLRFDYAETAFRFMFAADGQPWLASAITPYKGTNNTVSPFVALATRS
jgi:HK97 family phage major capsid protein